MQQDPVFRGLFRSKNNYFDLVKTQYTLESNKSKVVFVMLSSM